MAADESLDERIRSWRAELESKRDRTHQAVVHYEIGHLAERSGDEDQAVLHYRAAIKADGKFRPPLFALTRLFRRRGETAALVELGMTETRAATSPAEEASALVDSAILLEDRQARGSQARTTLQKAVARDPSSNAASLMLELHYRRGGDERAANAVVLERAERVHDAVLARLLEIEGLSFLAASGDTDAALDGLMHAADDVVERFRTLRAAIDVAHEAGRPAALRQALLRFARAAEIAARDRVLTSGPPAGVLPAFSNEEAARAEAAVAWHEASRLDVAPPSASDDDDEEAVAPAWKTPLQLLERAVALRPNDPLLRWERLEAHAEAGDLGAALREARGLLDRFASGPHAAVLHLRVAELAGARGDAGARLTALRGARAAEPESVVAPALLASSVLEGDPAEALVWLVERAEDSDGLTAGRLLWRAAQLAADAVADPEVSAELYVRAAEASAEPAPVWREAYGAALRLGVDPGEVTARLLEHTKDPIERGALVHDRYLQLRSDDASSAETDALLAAALEGEAPPAWAAHVARVRAARRGASGLLVAAHEALAGPEVDGVTAAAHLGAAGRALARAGDFEQAESTLRAALDRSPGDAYAVGLLEEVLRRRGDEGAVAALLCEEAALARDPRDAEPLLLRAADVAHGAGRVGLALDAWEAAASLDPPSTAALWELASRSPEAPRRARALEELAEHEVAAGKPGRAVFFLGEEYDLVARDPELAHPQLAAALAHEAYGPAAAVALLLSPGADAHRPDALDRLLRYDHGAGAARLRRVLAGEGGEAGFGRVLDSQGQDRVALLLALRGSPLDPEQALVRGEALASLARAVASPELAAELRLWAVWHGVNDAARAPEVLDGRAPLADAIALEDGAASTPGARAAALAVRFAHADEVHAPNVASALGRALVADARYAEALPILRDVVAKEPGDLAAWEALALAAREAGAHDDLVAACGRLARSVEGLDRALLLEEAGLALLDDLGRGAEGEARLAEAVAEDPRVGRAYGRLHDRFLERGEAQELEALVTRRAGVVHEATELGGLLLEEAQLRRVLERHEDAVTALQALLELDPGHAEAYALLAESLVHTSRWAEAVAALRGLARCEGVHDPQRRLALVAAARYQHATLGDPKAAYELLLEAAEAGPADEKLFRRMAAAAEDARLFAEAAEAFSRAAELTDGSRRADYERRAASLTSGPAEAIAAYQRALEAEPTDHRAAESLAELLDADARRRMAEVYRDAVLGELAERPGEPESLRKIRHAAIWAGDGDLELLALSAVSVVDELHGDESEALARLRPQSVELQRSLDDAVFVALRGPAIEGPWVGIVAEISEHVAAMDGLDPSSLGFGRKERVKSGQDDSVRDAVFSTVASFGLASDRFYAGGSDDSRVAVMPRGANPATWAVGLGVKAPLDPAARFSMGRACFGLVDGTLPLLTRDEDEAVALLCASAVVGETSVAGAPGDAAELGRALSKALPRRSRKNLAEALRVGAGDVAEVRAYCAAAQLAADRAGLLTAGDLRAALDARVGEGAQGAEVAGHVVGRELLRYWLSPEHRGARQALGIRASEEATPYTGALDGEEFSARQLESRRAPASGFFGDSGTTAEWSLDVASLPEQVSVTGVAPTEPSVPVNDQGRAGLLLRLAEGAAGVTETRLRLSAAEVLERDGEAARAREQEAAARAADPKDVLALRRMRRDAARRASWREVVALLEAELAMASSAEERGLLHAHLCVVRGTRLGEVSAARKAIAAAVEAAPNAPSLPLLRWDLEARAGEDEAALEALEAAATCSGDDALTAALWVQVARDAEARHDEDEAHRRYAMAAELDDQALDAVLGLARGCRAKDDVDGAVGAIVKAAELTNAREVREAFLRAAARLLHVQGGRPGAAAELLADSEGMPACEARAVGALQAGDSATARVALSAAAEEARRSTRARLLVRLAEVCLADGDSEEAGATLRLAGRADPTLHTVRVLAGRLAREVGDVRSLTRVARGSGQGILVAASRAALHDDTALEQKLLAQALEDESRAALPVVLSLDAAAARGDVARMTSLLKQEIEGTSSAEHRAGALLALHDLSGDADAEGALRDLREVAPGSALGLRQLIEDLGTESPARAASLWLEEAAGAAGERAAFAATMAGRLLAQVEGDAMDAYRRALAAAPGYPPALWGLEALARREGDDATLREVLLQRAEHVAEPRERAERLVEAALRGESADGGLLARAVELVPDDAVLHDLRLRLSGHGNITGHALAPEARAELLERSAVGAPEEWARALRLRAALAFEAALVPSSAAAAARAVLAVHPADAFATRILDRTERAAAEPEAVARRLSEAVEQAEEHAPRLVALDRLATFSATSPGQTAVAAQAAGRILELHPGHLASLRLLERVAMESDDDTGLAEVEVRLAAIAHPHDATAHARLAARLIDRDPNTEPGAEHALLCSAFDYADGDLWLTRRVEAVARDAGDTRTLAQALSELTEHFEAPLERVCAELRASEAIAEVRSPTLAATRVARAARSAPEHPFVQELLGELHLLGDNVMAAAEAFEEAGRRSGAPRRKAAVYERAASLWEDQIGDAGRAVKAYFLAAEADVVHGGALERLMVLLPEHRDAKRLGDLLATRLKHGGDTDEQVTMHVTLAKLRREQGELAAAKKSLRAALLLAPERLELLEMLYRLCRDQEDWRSAADTLVRASRLATEPKLVRSIYLQLGDSYARMRDHRRARGAWQQVLDRFPGDEAASQRIASIAPPRS